MEITIGPYKIAKRTEYSKTALFDKYTNENITRKCPGVLEKILSDYDEQIKSNKCRKPRIHFYSRRNH